MPKNETKTYGKPEIERIMQAFHDHWMQRPVPEKLQRRYCQMLIREFGDRADDLVKYALDIQKDYYAPVITSPKDLYYKRLNVTAYWRKHNEGGGKVLKV